MQRMCDFCTFVVLVESLEENMFTDEMSLEERDSPVLTACYSIMELHRRTVWTEADEHVKNSAARCQCSPPPDPDG